MHIEDKVFIIMLEALATITTIAASFLIISMVFINPIGQLYKSVVISNNPKVSISVNKDDFFTILNTLNQVVEVLFEDYSFKKRDFKYCI